MLIELTVTDFAIIDALNLRFGPHLNAFTGETGAGKSILVDAISALVGERATSDVVRAGCERAIVEGVFDISRLPAGSREISSSGAEAKPTALSEAVAVGGEASEEEALLLEQVLAQLGIEAEDGTLILTREIAASGRGIARINR